LLPLKTRLLALDHFTFDAGEPDAGHAISADLVGSPGSAPDCSIAAPE
jgi:hypothetical protein